MMMVAIGDRLSGFERLNPGVMGAAAVVVTATAACWIPARRATGISPVTALRQD